MEDVKKWFRRLTWGQKAGLVAVVVMVVLNRDSLPQTPDDWKAWIGVATMAAAALGVGSHGKDGGE